MCLCLSSDTSQGTPRHAPHAPTPPHIAVFCEVSSCSPVASVPLPSTESPCQPLLLRCALWWCLWSPQSWGMSRREGDCSKHPVSIPLPTGITTCPGISHPWGKARGPCNVPDHILSRIRGTEQQTFDNAFCRFRILKNGDGKFLELTWNDRQTCPSPKIEVLVARVPL